MDKVVGGPEARRNAVDYGAHVEDQEGGMLAPVQNLVQQATDESPRSTRRSVARMVDTIGPLSLALALATIALALGATGQATVSTMSGLAVALLVPAALVDMSEQRLPNPIVALAAVVAVAGLATSATSLRHAAGGALVLAGPLLAMHLVSPTSMGFGDVKAAAVLGVAVGTVHWQLAVGVLALATGITACVALVRGVRHIALGPGLVAGAAIGLSAHRRLLSPAALDTLGSLANTGLLG